ncbi:MAG: histidine kinase [Bacteroidia bacterium]|nr:histidine kinase [Bacteroidia bacterium]
MHYPKQEKAQIILASSWKIQVISSLLVGSLFGFYHFLLSEDDPFIFLYYTTNVFLLSLGLWQAAQVTFTLTEKRYSWFTEPYSRLVASLLLGTLFTYAIVYLVDYALPQLMDPLYGFSKSKQLEQPQQNLETFFLDGVISLFIFNSYLIFINLFHYFSAIQQQREKALESSLEKYFENLIENIQDVILVIQPDGKLRYCSNSIHKLSGYQPEELYVGVGFFSLLVDQDAQTFKEKLETWLSRETETITCEWRMQTKWGEQKPIECKLVNALQTPLIEGLICICSDNSERVNMDKKRQHQHELNELITRISAQFLNVDFKEAVNTMLQETGTFTGSDKAFLLLEQETSRDLAWTCFALWQDVKNRKESETPGAMQLAYKEAQWLIAEMQQKKLVSGIKNANSPELESLCARLDAEMLYLIPVSRNEKYYGCIGYSRLESHAQLTPEDLGMLHIASELLVSSMLRAQAEKEIQHSLSINTAIVESTSEGILFTDMEDQILYYNQNFKDMWELDDEVLQEKRNSKVLDYLVGQLENPEALEPIKRIAATQQEERKRMVMYLKNKRVLEGILQPQLIRGQVVGRVWSNRDITERMHAEKEEIEKGIAQAQFESLKNQVNPHFLFNSLNVLSSLVHIDANLSEKFIDQLAKSYRYLLEQKDNELVTLRTEIEFVEAFTFLLKIRFEDKLVVKINLSEEVLDYYIAPLTLQLLIENAVKHNSISNQSPLIIELYNPSNQELLVKNNLQLREQQMPSTGVGIKNIQERYKLLTPIPTEFYISNQSYISKIPLIKSLT